MKKALFLPAVTICAGIGVALVSVLVGVARVWDIELYPHPRSSGGRAVGRSAMRAVVYERFGDEEASGLEVRNDVPVPDYRSNDVLIRVHAAAVNHIDYKTIRGYMGLLPHWIKAKPPGALLGVDLAGVVEAVGSDVHRFHKGDPVFAAMNVLRPGAFAEFAVVREDLVAKKPKTLSYKDAASLPFTATTALQVLRDGVPWKKDMTVLILGGSSAVGYAAISAAKHLGANLVCATTNFAKVEHTLTANPTRVIVDGEEIFSQLHSVMHLSDRYEAGFDVVLDCIGGQDKFLLGQHVANTHNGTYISLVGDDDKTHRIGPYTIIRQFSKTLSQHTFGFGPKYKVFTMKPKGRDLNVIRHLVEDRRMKAYVDRVYPLSNISGAFKYLATGRAVGKVVIDMKEKKEKATS